MKRYDRAYRYLRPIMRSFMRELAARVLTKYEIFEDTYDDRGFTFIIPPCDEFDAIDVSIKLIDSNEYDTGIPDKWGTINFQAVRFGGEIIMDYSPFNYTDRVWCDLDDLPELKERLSVVMDSIDVIESSLNEAM